MCQGLLATLNVIAASGCASIQSYDASSDITIAPAHKVVLVEMPMLKDERLLQKQFAADLPAESSRSHEAISDAVAKAEALALADMRKALELQKGLTIDDSDTTAHALDELRLNNSDLPITQELARRLHAISGADDLLRFRITDYGMTPKAWRKAYIVFEVASTLAIAAIAYSYPRTRGIAGIYLVQEAVEETAEGYAGFWAINEVCRPVRIEAQLVSLHTGAETWRDTATGLSDIRLARVFRKVSNAEQDAQRQRATDQAARKVVAKIVEVLARSGAGSSP